MQIQFRKLQSIKCNGNTSAKLLHADGCIHIYIHGQTGRGSFIANAPKNGIKRMYLLGKTETLFSSSAGERIQNGD
jgi:hypothetical protein